MINCPFSKRVVPDLLVIDVLEDHVALFFEFDGIIRSINVLTHFSTLYLIYSSLYFLYLFNKLL